MTHQPNPSELLEDGIHGVYNHNDKDGLINANREGLI